MPNFDELDQVSCDPRTGKTKKLNDQQLKTIKDTGYIFFNRVANGF